MVAGDHDHARLGQDLLQLVDQIGFLRTIHANSVCSIEAGSDRGSTKRPGGCPPERQVSVGLGSMALPNTTHDEAVSRFE
jgi:hypothetical protein